jgi:hypothetical protein
MITDKTYWQAVAAPAYVEQRIVEAAFIDFSWRQKNELLHCSVEGLQKLLLSCRQLSC